MFLLYLLSIFLNALLPLTAIRNGLNQSCAACKYQRRRCSRDCPLAPFFPADEPQTFLSAHRLYGVRNILSILTKVSEEYKQDAMASVIYESNMRSKFPVKGCAGIISQLIYELRKTTAEIQLVQDQIQAFKSVGAQPMFGSTSTVDRERENVNVGMAEHGSNSDFLAAGASTNLLAGGASSHHFAGGASTDFSAGGDVLGGASNLYFNLDQNQDRDHGYDETLQNPIHGNELNCSAGGENNMYLTLDQDQNQDQDRDHGYDETLQNYSHANELNCSVAGATNMYLTLDQDQNQDQDRDHGYDEAPQSSSQPWQ